MAERPAVPSNARWFAVEQRDDVAVLRLLRSDLGDDEAAQALAGPLSRLVDDLGLRRFVLDFTPVVRVSSAVMGKLLAFQKKVHKAGGRLTLCGLRPHLQDLFERMKLNTLFPICATEQEAVEGVREPSASPAPLGDETPLPPALRRPRS